MKNILKDEFESEYLGEEELEEDVFEDFDPHEFDYLNFDDEDEELDDKKTKVKKTKMPKTGGDKMSLNLWGYGDPLPPALGQKQTVELIKEYQKYGDKEVRDKIVCGNLRFVAYYINKYGKYAINTETVCYPSFEDIAQECTMQLMTCIDRFNTDYQFQFSTFLSRSLHNRIGMIYRKGKHLPAFSLNDLVTDKDGNGSERMDFIADEKFDDEFFQNKADITFIKDNLIARLSDRDAEMIKLYYFHDMTNTAIAEELGYTQSYVSRRIAKITERLKEAYTTGNLECLDNLCTMAEKRVKKARGLIKKYGKDFLENYFAYRLTKNQAKLFEIGVLKYTGQSMNALAIDAEMDYNKVQHTLSALYNYIDNNIDHIYRQYLAGMPLPKRVESQRLKDQQRANRTERFMEEYGGVEFLQKYFRPTLGKKSQEAFDVLFVKNEPKSLSKVAKENGFSYTNLHNYYNRITDKIKQADFVDLVERIDNGTFFESEVRDEINAVKGVLAKRRFEILEKFGGAEFLAQHYLPYLTSKQQQAFENLYLTDKYATVADFAEEHNLSLASCHNMTNKIYNFLKEKSKEEIIEDEAVILAKKESNMHSKQDFVAKKEVILKAYGGKEFLEKYFVPRLASKIKEHFTELYLSDKYTSLRQYAEATNITVTNCTQIHSRLLRKLKMTTPEELMNTPFKVVKERTFKENILEKQRQEMVDKFGSLAFLEENLIPLLTTKQQEFFRDLYLTDDYSRLSQYAKDNGKSMQTCYFMQKRIFDFLEQSSPEDLLEYVKQEQEKAVVVPKENALDRQRKEWIEKFGSMEFLEEKFLPLLTEKQQHMFKNVYIDNKYKGLSQYSEEIGKHVNVCYVTQKKIVEMLKKTSVEELTEIASKSDYEAKMALQPNNRVAKFQAKNAKLVEEYGGQEFLAEMFVPTLEVNAYKIIFEECFFKGRPARELIEKLKLNPNSLYVNRACSVLREKLEAFRAGFENYDETIRVFHAIKEFKKLHPEDFGQLSASLQKPGDGKNKGKTKT